MTPTLDLRGLRCPVPVIRLEAWMRRADRGATITVAADDPLARIDLPHAAREAGFSCVARPSPDPRAFWFVVTAPPG